MLKLHIHLHCKLFANGKVIGCKQNSNVEVKYTRKNDFAFILPN